jgi:hypothetical protein
MAEKDRIITLRRRNDPQLYSSRADERLAAARAMNKRGRAALAAKATDWPANCPGSLNAWLLFVTTKPPVWRDPMLTWHDRPLALGEANESFFYPDPLGFWSEIRRWAQILFRLRYPTWGLGEALALTTLMHVGEDPSRFSTAFSLFAPRVVLFLDEPSWIGSGLEVRKQVNHYIKDPHRTGQVYEGFWGELDDGVVVGKAPQHPTTHKLYRADDMAGFLRSAPIPPP